MYRRDSKGWAKHLDFIIWDTLCLEIAFVFAYMLRHGLTVPFLHSSYNELNAVLLLLNFAVMLFFDTFKNVLKRGYYKEFLSILRQAVVLYLCITAYMFSAKISEEYSRAVMFSVAVLYLVLGYAVRLLWKKHLHEKMKGGSGSALLIVTEKEKAADLINDLRMHNLSGNRIVGLVLPDTEGKEHVLDEAVINDIPVVADLSNIVEYVTGHWVDEILFSFPEYDHQIMELIEQLTCMGTTVHVSLNGFTRGEGTKQVVSHIGSMMVLSNTMNYMTPRQYYIKRAFDICGGLVGCLITGILYLFLAPAIKRESPGPVFYSQNRIGQNGRVFKMYKFRSMYLDADERKAELLAKNRLNNNLMFKMDFDPRVIGNKLDENGNQVTGIGAFIRKYSLDEFPQFFNVLKGDMSLVGTRPPLPSEYEEYSAHHKARLAVRPGITGMWQTSGRSDILDFEEVVKLDTEYINNWTIGLDVKILLKTVKVVFGKEGSM